jgi:hypothetical protein
MLVTNGWPAECLGHAWRWARPAAALGFALAVAPVPAFAKTLGYVMTTWNLASYETRFIDECPDGFAMGYDELWWRGLSKEDRGRLTKNGQTVRQDRYAIAAKRGRNGEDTCLAPTSVDTPPMAIIDGKFAHGFDLDNNTDGSPTAKTCPHQTFTSPDGTPGIDNQMYRLLGCTFGFRSFGYFDANPNDSRKMQGLGVILIEVRKVDDTRNDDDVEVRFYRSIDPYPIDATSNFIAHASFRIDGQSRYGNPVKARIVDGKLTTTEVADVHLPSYGNYAFMDMFLRDMRFELTMSGDGRSARGMFGGYVDVEELSHYIGSLGVTHSTTYSDCASIHATATTLADGYPDPTTGRCTALSAAYHINAVAAYIIHPEQSAAAP